MPPGCARCRRRSRSATRASRRPLSSRSKPRARSTTPTSPARSRPAVRWRSPGCIPPPAARDSNCAPATCCLKRLVACAGVTLKAVATAIDIPLQFRHGLGRRRSRFPRHARRRQGRAGRLRADQAALRRRHRRAAGKTRSAAQAHRALLRGLSDHPQRSAGRHQHEADARMSGSRRARSSATRDAALAAKPRRARSTAAFSACRS